MKAAYANPSQAGAIRAGAETEYRGSEKTSDSPTSDRKAENETEMISSHLREWGNSVWKASWGAVILNQALGVRVEHVNSSKNIGP